MALTGLKSFNYGVLTEHANGSVTYEAPKKLAGAISSKVKFNTNSTELYSDDVLKYSDYSVSSATLTLQVDEADNAIFAPLLGKKAVTFTDGDGGTHTTYETSANDVIKPVGFGYITSTAEGKYKVLFFKKVKFKPFTEDAQTKGDKVTFQTPTVEGVASALADGSLTSEGVFDTVELAKEYLESLFVQTPYVPGP